MAELTLDGDNLYDDHESQTYSDLEKLTLELMGELDFEQINTILQKCTSLEKLHVDISFPAFDFDCIVIIRIPTLKELTMKVTTDNFGGSCMANMFVIDTPNLESLVILDNNLCDIEINEISSTLNHANIELGNSCYFEYFELDEDDTKPRAMEILKGVRNSTKLTLGSGFSNLLNHGFDENDRLPKFPNLKHLVWYLDYEFVFRLLHLMLENSPNLETLELHREMTGQDSSYYGFGWTPPSEVPRCVKHNLTDVQVTGMVGLMGGKGRRKDWKAIKYLLGNGKKLEKMSVEFEDMDGTEANIIQSYPRASQECRVEILEFKLR